MSLLSDARKYARAYQPRLRMNDWRFTVNEAEYPHGDEGAGATCLADSEVMKVEIQVWPGLRPQRLPEIMAHEMGHAVLHEMRQCVIAALGELPEDYRRAEERACWRIARALVTEVS